MIGRGIVVGIAVAAVASCVVFTGGTSGYSAEDAGVTVNLACAAANACDAGSVCCLTQSTSSVISKCTASACVFPSLQLCLASNECTGELECIYQDCFGASLSVCGLQSFCNRHDGGVADASADGGVVGADASSDSGFAHDANDASANDASAPDADSAP